MPTLLAVPNVSTAGDAEALRRLGEAFGRGARILDVHTDADHGRTVFTLAGEPGGLAESLVAGAEEALETIDMSTYMGLHPAIGALDVCPIVWLRPEDRDAARIEAVAIAGQIGGIGVPVFLYGELARGTGAGRARLLPQRRPRRALAADGRRRAAPRLRAVGPAPARRRDPGHRPPAARRLQRRARGRRPRRSRAPSPPGLREAGGGRPACGRSA